MADATLWMPSGMDDGEKAEHDEAHPGDPHGAAAAAWESWAAQLAGTEATGQAPTSGVLSVSTGAQSVTYAEARTAGGAALQQAAWHRARSAAGSVVLGPIYEVNTEVGYRQDTGVMPGDVLLPTNDENNDALWTESP